MLNYSLTPSERKRSDRSRDEEASQEEASCSGGWGAHTNSLSHTHTHKRNHTLPPLPPAPPLARLFPTSHSCFPLGLPPSPAQHPHPSPTLFFFPHPSSFPLLRKLLLSSPPSSCPHAPSSPPYLSYLSFSHADRVSVVQE